MVEKSNKKQNLIIIDAGVENIHLRINNNGKISSYLIQNNDQIRILFEKAGIMAILKDKKFRILITGKLADIVKKTLGRGEVILPAAALWTEANYLKNKFKTDDIKSLGIVDLSASGYMVIAIDKNGRLKKDLLSVNPRCGAGSGINLKRILEKLDIKQERVDEILKQYLGDKGKKKREEVLVRADRCGVFSSSATISDKNQGIPLENALAVTMKSEVLKAVKKMHKGTDKVFLTGRVFNWQYMRDCASDYLESVGVKEIIFDRNQSMFINGVAHLAERIGINNFKSQAHKLSKEETMEKYPGFKKLKRQYESSGHYKRIKKAEIKELSGKNLEDTPVNIGLDVGSTMAKILMFNADTNQIIFKGSFDNHGDTIDTMKYIFKSIKERGANSLKIRHIGLTGSGRYQMQKILQKVYPELGERVFVLVENYAHAYGSIDYAREHIKSLKKTQKDINDDFYVLLDIGGEDTKVSVISLKKEELYDNVMNIKCSAGTGSLMDTLKSLFGIDSINEATTKAFEAEKAYDINATCAVFLMENAKRLQALGYKKDEILASCNYAIVENMARTLWNQVDFPEKAVVMLHGQTMLSEPLPIAATHRLQEEGEMYALVPPMPGHRACIGLINSIKDKKAEDTVCKLDDFINLHFDKKIINCYGVACGDKEACCARTLLTAKDADNLNLMLGGCTAINELNTVKKTEEKAIDSYQKIWKYIDSQLPRSEAKNRLVIPRSFAVSEQAYFLSQIFEHLEIPVYVDNVQEQDILTAQPNFDIDVCSPLIGATGQFIRLAGQEHGIILAPQIDYLPTGGLSLGRTCTTNQGGIPIARKIAKAKVPKSNFHLFDLSLQKMESKYIAEQLISKLAPVFEYYKINITEKKLEKAIEQAINKNIKLKAEVAELTKELLEQAIKEKRNTALVCAREYILNPGIYDSHVGRLLRDKGVVAIPSYALETELDPEFKHVYWKNSHDIISKASGIAKKELHKIVKNEQLKELVKKIETSNDSGTISFIQVSTFRCGPDTVTTPIIAELTKKYPSLLIQSDAVIKELAHLENRVNTYINQLNKKLFQNLKSDDYEVSLMDDIGTANLRKDTDILYMPTMHDNRILTSILRGAGYTVIDNFDDEYYDLEKKTKLGRKYAGDAVCSPLASVFADMVLGVEDFIARKKAGDKIVEGKTRVLIVDSKGTGPCRQGQYYEVHKLLLGKKYGCGSCGNKKNKLAEQIKLLVSCEEDAYDIGVDEWVLVQAFHGLVLQGVLHSIYLKYGAGCRDYKEYQKFYKDYLKLKDDVFHILEDQTRPSDKKLKIAEKLDKRSSSVGAVFKYFGYGLHNNNGLRKRIKAFSNKWSKVIEKNPKNKINIHVEGEVYVRVAQLTDIFKSVIDSIGFNSFKIDYSPLWCYFELVLELEILDMKDNLNIGHETRIKDGDKMSSAKLKMVTKILRNVLAKPLYDAGGVKMPAEMSKVLKATRSVLSTIKPIGELPPYIGEAILKIEDGTDLFLNIAPEGCMVASMGQLFSQAILDHTKKKARIEDLFTLNGELNNEKLELALLKVLGPVGYYKKRG